MDRDVLQVFTAAFISELDMEKSRKVDLLEYVSVAGKDELLYYLATGNIATGFIQESELLSRTETVVEGLIVEALGDKVGKVVSNVKRGLQGLKTGYAYEPVGKAQKVGLALRTAKEKVKGAPAATVAAAKKGYAAGKEGVKTGAAAVGKFAGEHKKGIGIALAIAAATAASYAAYKRFFSKAAKECKGAADRAACIKGFKKKAALAKAAALQAGMSKCASSNNPEKCKASLAKKVAKAKAEAASIG